MSNSFRFDVLYVAWPGPQRKQGVGEVAEGPEAYTSKVRPSFNIFFSFKFIFNLFLYKMQ